MKKTMIWNPIEQYSQEELNQVESLLFEQQFDYMMTHSLFYQRKLAAWQRGPRPGLNDLIELPFTDKQELIDDQLKLPPFGSNLTVPEETISRVHRTSGTTARPLLLALSKNDIQHTIECGARCFWAAGLRPHDVVVHCLNYCMWAGGITDHQSLEQTGAGVVPFGVGNSAELIRIILMIKPTAIHCTPSYLAVLELLLKQEFDMRPSDLGLKLGLFGGEAGLQDENFRQQIEEIWGFQAMDANYGMADVLSMFGAECQVRGGLHFMGQGVVHPELKDLVSNEILPWEPGIRGELVLTNLCKECQPLVRFRTRDVVQITGMGLCECGRRSPRFRVIGRMDDMIVVKGVNVFISAIASVVNQHLDTLTGEFRVLVDKMDPIRQCIVRVERKTKEGNEELKHKLGDHLVRVLSIKPLVEVFPMGSLPRTGGKAKHLERTL